MIYRLFSSPLVLVESLLHSIQTPIQGQAQGQTHVIRLRILLLLRYWLENYAGMDGTPALLRLVEQGLRALQPENARESSLMEQISTLLISSSTHNTSTSTHMSDTFDILPETGYAHLTRCVPLLVVASPPRRVDTMRHWTDRWASRFASSVRRKAQGLLDQAKADFYQIPLYKPLSSPSNGSDRNTNMPLLTFKSLALAEQLTLIDSALLNSIHWIEILNWSHDKNAPHLDRFIDHFNKLSEWSLNQILAASPSPTLQTRLLEKFIRIAHVRPLLLAFYQK